MFMWLLFCFSQLPILPPPKIVTFFFSLESPCIGEFLFSWANPAWPPPLPSLCSPDHNVRFSVHLPCFWYQNSCFFRTPVLKFWTKYIKDLRVTDMTNASDWIRSSLYDHITAFTGYRLCRVLQHGSCRLLCPADAGFLWDVVTVLGDTLKGAFSRYRCADKSLARPGRKQATAKQDFEFHISYL